MKRLNWRLLFLLMIYSNMFLLGCKKQDTLYDLFPLKAGNVFYYSYSYQSMDFPLKKSYGNKIWTILVDSVMSNSVEYTFEEKYNGILISKKIPSSIADTLPIIDSIRYFKVIEDKSGQLSFLNLNPTWNITLQRFQNVSDTTIHNWIGMNYQRDYQFQANKGLVYYVNAKGPISNWYSEIYTLDGVMLNH